MSRRSASRPDRTPPLGEIPHYVYIYIYIYLCIYIYIISLPFFLTRSLSHSLFSRWLLLAMAEERRRSPGHPRHGRRAPSFFALEGNNDCCCGGGGDDARGPTVSVALLTVLGRSSDCYAARGCTCASVLRLEVCACGTPIGGHSSRRGQSERPMHLPPASATASRSLFLPHDPSLSACAFTLFTTIQLQGARSRDLVTSSTLAHGQRPSGDDDPLG